VIRTGPNPSLVAVPVERHRLGRMAAGTRQCREAVMAPRRRIKKLAVLMDTTPETLVEVMGDVLRETVDELQKYKPRACGRMARDIRRHRQMNPGASGGT